MTWSPLAASIDRRFDRSREHEKVHRGQVRRVPQRARDAVDVLVDGDFVGPWAAIQVVVAEVASGRFRSSYSGCRSSMARCGSRFRDHFQELSRASLLRDPSISLIYLEVEGIVHVVPDSRMRGLSVGEF